MAPTLKGNILSTCAARVLITAGVAGFDVNLEEVGFETIHKPEWKQPFNQMPYLIDEDGFELFESRAIAKYLAVKNGSDLVPSHADAKAWALFDQGCSIEQANFDPAASGLAWELIFSGMFGAPSDKARAEKLAAELKKKLEGYERVLSKQKYIGGDKLTVVDLFHLPYGAIVAQLGVVPSLTDGSLPHVKAWWDSLTALPAWKDYEAKKNAALAAMKK